jgi:hypothetical protein
MMGATSRSPNRALRRIPWRAVLAALAAAIIAGVMLLSQWPSLRYLARLDLARATKERAQ